GWRGSSPSWLTPRPALYGHCGNSCSAAPCALAGHRPCLYLRGASRIASGTQTPGANVRGSSVLQRVPTYEHRLANGLTVLIREDHSAPVVAIVTHVKAGYFNEPDRLVGISHVLEHMYFKGTEQRGPGQMARETKAA